MIPLQKIIDRLDAACPSALAEEWDNVGFLIGERDRSVGRIMTCLTVTSETVDEAADEGADLIVSHHPFPFRSDRRWTSDNPTGRTLLRLIRNGIAVYSPHTAHDSAFFGINRQLADLFALTDVKPLIPGQVEAADAMLDGIDPRKGASLGSEAGFLLGSGRIGTLRAPTTLRHFIESVCVRLKIPSLTWVGRPERSVSKVAIGCGAADDFIPAAADAGADLLLLGEVRFHGALLAEELDMALVLPGHYATERFAMETMAERIGALFPDLTVWPSQRESDPIRYYFQT